jgi:outer membrane immunogenic protein
MRLFNLSTLAIVLASSQVMAADLPSKKSNPIAPQTVTQWDGFYIGTQVGYAFGRSSQADVMSADDGSYTVKGGLIGATAGYNKSFNSVVLGVEGDAAFVDGNGSSASCSASSPHVCGTDVRSFETLRVRAGLPFGATLPYLTGGIAVASVKAYDNSDPSYVGSQTKTGWTIGGGVEQKLMNNWSVKAEYLYADLGKTSYFNVNGNVPEDVSLRQNILRIGVNYAF